MRNTLLSLVHFVVIVAALSSPLWLAWQGILVGVILYYIQLIMVGSCLLSLAQFGRSDKDISFWVYMLEVLGFRIHRVFVNRFVDFVLPWLILIIAFIIKP